ncbi:unnamed protein product [Mytilus coruscus]|uniref:Uncharacterized protein n=1 Tax=Mytilus coruscus TaxID=42192 RepID=A0A6J8EKF6_MYTCO|nr:unnamed protein product [Mytilus coruscus]
MDQLGKISVKKTTISLPFKEARVDQAQLQLPVPEIKSINNIHVKLKKRFKVNTQKRKDIWLNGCTMLLNGEDIWVHKEESLIDPSGIAVDNHQNVFVADEASNSLIVIQHDGSSSKKLLSESMGRISQLLYAITKTTRQYYCVMMMDMLLYTMFNNSMKEMNFIFL